MRQVERAELGRVALREDPQHMRQPLLLQHPAHARDDLGQARHVGRVLGMEVVAVAPADMHADAGKRPRGARLSQPVLAAEVPDQRIVERRLVVGDAVQGAQRREGEGEVDGIARVGRLAGAEVELRFPGGGPLRHRPFGMVDLPEGRVSVGEAVGAGELDRPHGHQRLRARALERRADAGDLREPAAAEKLADILPVEDVAVRIAVRTAERGLHDVLGDAPQVAERTAGQKREGCPVHTSLPSTSVTW